VNQTASLTASGGSGTGYVWSAPGGSPATGTGASFSTSYGTVGSKPVTLTDSNSNSSSCSVNVGSQQSGTPSVSISATPLQIVLGQPATVSWSSTNTTSCIASGGWSGTKTTSGTETVMTKQGVQPSFTIICSGPNGTVSNMTALNVFVPVSFKASASTISPGQSVTLTWSAPGATACNPTDGDNAWVTSGQNKPTSGSMTITPSGTATYGIDCYQGYHDNFQWTTVTVAPTGPPPAITSVQFDVSTQSLTINGSGFIGRSNTMVIGTQTYIFIYGSPTSITFDTWSIGAGTYPVSVSNQNGKSNTVQVTVTKGGIEVLPPVPNPSTVKFEIKPLDGYGINISGRTIAYLNGENTIYISGSRIKKGVVLDFFLSDGVTQTGTVPVLPTGWSLDQSCGSSENTSRYSCTVAFQLSLGNTPSAAGSYFYRARNTDGSVSNMVPFTVQLGPQLVFDVLVNGIAQAQAIQGKTYTLDILGANFVSGGTVTIQNVWCFSVFCNVEGVGGANKVTVSYEFVSAGHLKATWTAPVDGTVVSYALQINNPDGTHPTNLGLIRAYTSAQGQSDNPRYSVTPISGSVGTTFNLCSNNPITVTQLILFIQNGATMIVPAQTGASCPSGQSGLSFTMGSTISAIPGFAEANGNSPYYPQTFNVVPGFYHFTTAYGNGTNVHLSGKAAQDWTIEIK